MLKMNKLMGYDIEDLEVGMTARFSKTITEADIVLFAGVSGDNNRHAHKRGVRIRNCVCRKNCSWDAFRKRYIRRHSE
jgi:hypothetical protein